MKIVKVEGHVKVGQNLVGGNEITSSDQWTSFKKNLDKV